MTKRKSPEYLKSLRCFGAKDLRSFGHRLYQIGYDWQEIDARPVIAIINMLPEPGCSRGGYLKWMPKRCDRRRRLAAAASRPRPSPNSI